MNKNIYVIFSVVVTSLIITSCVSTQATMLSSKKYKPLKKEQVTIYLSKEDIPGEFEKVAIIDAKGSSTWTNKSQMYKAARKKAAKIGANGVLIKGIDEASQGEKIAGAFLGTGTNRNGEMVAIYVKKDENRK